MEERVTFKFDKGWRIFSPYENKLTAKTVEAATEMLAAQKAVFIPREMEPIEYVRYFDVAAPKHYSDLLAEYKIVMYDYYGRYYRPPVLWSFADFKDKEKEAIVRTLTRCVLGPFYVSDIVMTPNRELATIIDIDNHTAGKIYVCSDGEKYYAHELSLASSPLNIEQLNLEFVKLQQKVERLSSEVEDLKLEIKQKLTK